MPKSLEKTRKQIAKKRHGAIEALHKFSRDSKRLHKAQVRDERLEKIAAARRKQDQPLIDRVTFFQSATRENQTRPLEKDAIQDCINQYVHRYDDDYDAAKKARRPGRPASAREDLLKVKVEALQKEYENGFFLPDLTTQENVELLDKWEGSWAYLANLAWVRMSKSGAVKSSKFPPSGQ